jgi:phosphohistidine phosphatase
MQRLILFRHARTEARAPDGEDIDRVLTERGRADARLVGAALAGAGLAPDLVLVSPATRARETWDLAAPQFRHPRVEVREGLYDATAQEVQAELAHGADGFGCVMVVGHNPSLHELAVDLLVEGGAPPADVERLAVGFPTATAAVFALDAAGRASLEELFHARGGDDG